MKTIATVMYRNPVEEWLWESGVITWFALILLGVILFFAAYLGLAYLWDKWRGRK